MKHLELNLLLKTAFLFPLSLLVGFMAVVQWSLVPAQNGLSGPAYATLEKGMNNVMRTLTPTLMIFSLVAGLLLVVIAWRQGAQESLLLSLAVVALVVMIATTLPINAPVNAAIDGWDIAALPAAWQELRDRWEFGHAIRSYVGLAGLLAAIVASSWDARCRRTRTTS